MEQRVSVVTLGVRDVARSWAFCEALGGQGASPDGEGVFLQASVMGLALWGRDLLAAA